MIFISQVFCDYHFIQGCLDNFIFLNYFSSRLLKACPRGHAFQVSRVTAFLVACAMLIGGRKHLVVVFSGALPCAFSPAGEHVIVRRAKKR